MGEGEAAVDSVASATTGFKKNIMNFVTNFVPPTILQKRNYEEGSSFAGSSVMQDSPPLGGIEEDEEAGQVGPPRPSILGAKVTGSKLKPSSKPKPTLAELSTQSGKKKKSNLFALSPISEAVSVASPKPLQASASKKAKSAVGKVSSVSVAAPQLTLSELRSRALASKKGKLGSVVEVPSASADIVSSPPPPPPSMNVSGDTTESVEE